MIIFKLFENNYNNYVFIIISINEEFKKLSDIYKKK